MTEFYDSLSELLAADVPFVAVTIVDASGSIPSVPGAKMLVTMDGRVRGTVGGGKVERRAIDEAQGLLGDPRGRQTHFAEWSLNKDIGMTCGGSVRVYFEVHNADPWRIVIFGAGHVAGALTAILTRLDCRITCIDPRPEWLQRLPVSTNLTTVFAEDMPSHVARIPEGAFVLLMTMGHGSDKPILLEILRTRRFPYIGVIGSRAKAVRLRRDIAEAGLPESSQNAFYCPVGLDIGSNEPEEIAISVAAQLLQERDRVRRDRRIAPAAELPALG